MFKTLILISAFNGLIYGLRLTDQSYTPCPEIPNKVESIDVTPCDAEPCAFTRGTQVNIVAKFVPNEASSNCRIEMAALLGGWIPIVNEAVCGTSLNCPLNAESVNTLDWSTGVDNALPAGETETKWKLICDSGATETFCAEVKVNVK